MIETSQEVFWVLDRYAEIQMSEGVASKSEHTATPRLHFSDQGTVGLVHLPSQEPYAAAGVRRALKRLCQQHEDRDVGEQRSAHSAFRRGISTRQGATAALGTYRARTSVNAEGGLASGRLVQLRGSGSGGMGGENGSWVGSSGHVIVKYFEILVPMVKQQCMPIEEKKLTGGPGGARAHDRRFKKPRILRF